MVVSHEASRTGAPAVALEVIRAMRPLGVATTAMLRWGGSREPDFREVADQTVFEPLRHLRVALRQQRRTRRLAIPLEVTAARRALRRHRPDLVWANTALSSSFAKAALAESIPTVLHTHEVSGLLRDVLSRYDIDWDHPMLTLVACSQPAAADLRAIAGREPLVILSRPSLSGLADIATTAAGPAEVITIATFDRRKGADVFVEAARMVRALPGHDRVRFRWVGRRSDLTIDPGDVELVGEVADVRPFLATASVVVQPSRADAFPLSVIEAMAAGKPVVASAVGGIPDQLGDTGVLVPAESPQALADAIAALLADPDRRAALGHAARQRAFGQFDAATMRVEIRGLAERLLSPG